MRSIFAVAVASLAACSSDPCSQEQGLLTQASQTATKCANEALQDAGVPFQVTSSLSCTLDMTTCESGLKACSAADLSALEAALICLSEQYAQLNVSCDYTKFGLGTGCAPDAGGISQACEQAFASANISCPGLADGGAPAF